MMPLPDSRLPCRNTVCPRLHFLPEGKRSSGKTEASRAAAVVLVASRCLHTPPAPVRYQTANACNTMAWFHGDKRPVKTITPLCKPYPQDMGDVTGQKGRRVSGKRERTDGTLTPGKLPMPICLSISIVSVSTCTPSLISRKDQPAPSQTSRHVAANTTPTDISLALIVSGTLLVHNCHSQLSRLSLSTRTRERRDPLHAMICRTHSSFSR